MDAQGEELARSEGFGSRAEAEAWMREHYEHLLDEGGESVTLLGDEGVVYEMGLRPE